MTVRSIKAQFVSAVAAEFSLPKDRIPALVRDAIRCANGDPITSPAVTRLAQLELIDRGLVIAQAEAVVEAMDEPVIELTGFQKFLAQARGDLKSLIAISGLKATIEIERKNHKSNSGNAFRQLLNRYVEAGGYEGMCAYAQAAMELGIHFRQDNHRVQLLTDIEQDGGPLYHDYIGSLKQLEAMAELNPA